MWPITKESIERVTDNTYLYTRKPPNKSWVRNEEDYDEEEYFEEEEDFLRLSLEEYDDLTINEKHMYVDKLGYYFDFDPALVRPSEYESMTEEEREEYDSEMRWMASPEFENYLRFEDLDNDEIEALSSENDKIGPIMKKSQSKKYTFLISHISFSNSLDVLQSYHKSSKRQNVYSCYEKIDNNTALFTLLKLMPYELQHHVLYSMPQLSLHAILRHL